MAEAAHTGGKPAQKRPGDEEFLHVPHRRVRVAIQDVNRLVRAAWPYKLSVTDLTIASELSGYRSMAYTTHSWDKDT